MTQLMKFTGSFCGLLAGFELILSLAPGQEPKGEKGEKGKGKIRSEGEFVRKYAEKFAKGDTPNLDRLEGEVEKMFRSLDRDGDGVLSSGELSEELAPLAGQIDRNADVKISLDEYRAYLQQQLNARVEGLPPPEPKRDKNADREKKPEPPGAKEATPQDEPLPTVHHDPNKYPKELPAWFKELDTDRDMQVGLYEWRRGKRKLEEFLEMDLNSDGFLEIEEYFRFVKRK